MCMKQKERRGWFVSNTTTRHFHEVCIRYEELRCFEFWTISYRNWSPETFRWKAPGSWNLEMSELNEWFSGGHAGPGLGSHRIGNQPSWAWLLLCRETWGAEEVQLVSWRLLESQCLSLIRNCECRIQWRMGKYPESGNFCTLYNIVITHQFLFIT